MNLEKDVCQPAPLRRSAAGGGPQKRTRDGSWRNRKHKSQWDGFVCSLMIKKNSSFSRFFFSREVGESVSSKKIRSPPAYVTVNTGGESTCSFQELK
jgi:hypothetical protein